LARHLKLPFPVALDIKGEAGAAFGSIKGTPTSFLLDADGNLVKRYIGAIDLNKLTKQIDQLMGTG
jgi:protein-disulfide isomerase